jgi:ribosome-associated protein
MPGESTTYSTNPDEYPQNEGKSLVVQGRLVAPAAAFDFSFVSSGGPGGQNVNKRATKCVMRVAAGSLALTPTQLGRLRGLAGSLLTSGDELVIASDEHKSQGRNRTACLDRLAELVRRALVVPKVRKKTRPSRGAKERRITAKKRAGDIKRGRTERHD